MSNSSKPIFLTDYNVSPYSSIASVSSVAPVSYVASVSSAAPVLSRMEEKDEIVSCDASTAPVLSAQTWWKSKFSSQKTVVLAEFTTEFVNSFSNIQLSNIKLRLQVIPNLFLGWDKNFTIKYDDFVMFVASFGKKCDTIDAVKTCCEWFFNSDGQLVPWWSGKRSSSNKDVMFLKQTFLMRFSDEGESINVDTWWLTIVYKKNQKYRKMKCSLIQGVLTLYNKISSKLVLVDTINSLKSLKKFIYQKTMEDSILLKYDDFVYNMIRVALGYTDKFLESNDFEYTMVDSNIYITEDFSSYIQENVDSNYNSCYTL